MERNQVVDQAFHSVKWVALATFLPRLITPLSAMLLAALLSPEDFGTVAVATVIITLAQLIVGLGMGQAVIQRRTEVEEAASIGFFLSLLVALVLCLVLWLLSPSIAQVYDNPDLVAVIRVSSLALILNAFYAIPNALMQREMQFKRLFWVGVAPVVVTALVSIFLAVNGARYWALVFGMLSGLLVNVVLVWYYVHPFRPKLIFKADLARSLLSFSVWIVFSGFLSWLFLYADNAIAGYYFGAKGIGEYSLGFNISNLLPGMIISTVSIVAYPAFCALQEDRTRLGNNLIQTQTQAATVIFPLCLGVSALSSPAVSLLYGEKWPDLGWIISWLVIMPGMSHLWSLNADAFRAVGKPGAWAFAAGLTLIVMLPLLALAGNFSLQVFVITRVVVHFLYPTLIMLIGTRILSLGFGEQVSGLVVQLACALVMFFAVLVLRSFLQPFAGLTGWLKLGFLAAAGAAVYGLLLWVIQRELLVQLIKSTRRVLSPS